MEQATAYKKLQGCLKDIFAFSISKVYDKQDAEDGAKTHNKVYVSGMNLSPDIARDQMVMTKLQFGKTDKILAYHGYQSFLPGEVTPDMAHEISIFPKIYTA